MEEKSISEGRTGEAEIVESNKSSDWNYILDKESTTQSKLYFIKFDAVASAKTK